MRISCPHCERIFDADDASASGIDKVRCYCGATLLLHEAGGRSAERLGRYTLVNQIAAGGMGEVWFALMGGARGFEKEVAIKRLLPGLAGDDAFSAMLLKEAKVTALMNHPNVAEVYDLAEVMGQILIVMEYVPGIPIDNLISTARSARVKLPREIGLVVTLQALRGLHYAHDLTRGGGRETMLHRDISPQNLLITREAVVKIVDFGIAKAATEVTNTAPNILRGKVSYQAPERLRGGPPTIHTDLYPTAIVLFECWAMRDLFRGANTQETIHKIITGEVPPITNLRDDITPGMEDVLLRALDTDPKNRYQSAGDFEKALLSACPGRNFEDLQAKAARFLEKHANLFFSGVATHKTPPGSLPESTRKILYTGSLPGIESILRQTLHGQMFDNVSTERADLPMRTPRRQIWAVAGLMGILAALAGTLYFWDTSREPAPAAEREAYEAARPETYPATQPTNSRTIGASAPAGASTPAKSGATTSPADPCTAVDGSGLPLAVREATGGLVDLDASSAAPNPTASPLPGSGTEAAEPPSAAEMSRFFRRRSALLLRCFEHSEEGLDEDVPIRIEPGGTLKADLGKTSLARFAPCFEARLRRLKFRPFNGPPVTYVWPLRLFPE